MSPTKPAPRRRIESLNDQQKAQMAVYRDRWTKIGLSTEPADRPAAEQAITAMYATAQLPAPKRTVWTTSPLANALTRAIIMQAHKSQSGASVRDSVGASVWASVRDSVRASVVASVGASVYGQHDAGWLAFYAYFREVCGLTTETEKIVGLTGLSKAAGWAIPHQHICWVSERHNRLCLDARGRLHCTNAQALSYPDGWGIWAWHGVRVPQAVIEHPESIHAAALLQEPNTEIKRVMLERMGMSRFLAESRANCIHHDTDGMGGPRNLYRIKADWAEGGYVTILGVIDPAKVRRGESADVFLRVPPEITMCDAATAWTFGVDLKEYKPLIEA